MTSPALDKENTDVAALVQRNAELTEQVKTLTHQLDLFKKLLFGARSEKRPFDLPGQGALFTPDTDTSTPSDTPKETVTYERGKAKKHRGEDCVNAHGLRFTEDVPVKTIRLTPPEIDGLSEDEYEVIKTESRYKLAQQAASYVLLHYQTPVVKLKRDASIVSAPAPVSILDKSVADVSFLAGLLVDKFLYHLPLYRQHQRLEAAGFTLARSTLTHLVKRAIALLEPVVEAQWRHVLTSHVLAMDETPIKAGRSKTRKGRMHQGYFWPLYGEDDEVVFTYSESRARRVIEQLLGNDFSGILLSDGYKAYASYAARCANVTSAQCWTHTRRQFVDAREDEPHWADEILDMIGALYVVEDTIRTDELTREEKLERRLEKSKPIVDAITTWVDTRLQDPSLLPKAPFAQALGYLREREAALRVFLTEPDVPLDTNHLERALRPIPMGRRNWLFCSTELGAEHVGIIQSLLTTCKLHGVDPYAYLVDVLQRIATHPNSDVIELTPRLWKTHFANNPILSDITRSE